jgi:hypothetical protein
MGQSKNIDTKLRLKKGLNNTNNYLKISKDENNIHFVMTYYYIRKLLDAPFILP